MRPAHLLLVVAVLWPLAHATAQQPGQRIRAQTPSSRHWLVGTLIATDPDSLRLFVDGAGQPVAVGWRDVTRVEVSRGHGTRMLDGLAAGFALGFAGGANAAADRDEARVCPNDLSGICVLNIEADVVQEGVLVGAAGAVLGAVVGSRVRTERWEKVRF